MCDRKCLMAEYCKAGKWQCGVLYMYFILFSISIQKYRFIKQKTCIGATHAHKPKGSDENFWPVIRIIAFLVHKHMMNTIKIWYSKINKLPNPARLTVLTHKLKTLNLYVSLTAGTVRHFWIMIHVKACNLYTVVCCSIVKNDLYQVNSTQAYRHHRQCPWRGNSKKWYSIALLILHINNKKSLPTHWKEPCCLAHSII